jgi:uncharacterized SAM-binding protein YcdF (DUF218 family)
VRRTEYGGIFSRLLFLIFFLAMCGFFYVVRHPLMRLAGEFWVLNDAATQSDVLIVLGDDNYTADRVAHAAELYRMGLAPIVVASGRALRPYAGISEMMERDLETHGVPVASIVKFSHRGENTREEAEALAGLITGRGWKRVLIVTSNYHARRARFIFARVLPPNVDVHVNGASDSEFDPSRWWETRQGRKLFFGEVLGYVIAWWELRGKPGRASGATVLVVTGGALTYYA